MVEEDDGGMDIESPGSDLLRISLMILNSESRQVTMKLCIKGTLTLLLFAYTGGEGVEGGLPSSMLGLLSRKVVLSNIPVATSNMVPRELIYCEERHRIS